MARRRVIQFISLKSSIFMYLIYGLLYLSQLPWSKSLDISMSESSSTSSDASDSPMPRSSSYHDYENYFYIWIGRNYYSISIVNTEHDQWFTNKYSSQNFQTNSFISKFSSYIHLFISFRLFPLFPIVSCYKCMISEFRPVDLFKRFS